MTNIGLIALGLGIGAVAVSAAFYAGVFYGACVMDTAYKSDDSVKKDITYKYAKMYKQVVQDFS